MVVANINAIPWHFTLKQTGKQQGLSLIRSSLSAWHLSDCLPWPRICLPVSILTCKHPPKTPRLWGFKGPIHLPPLTLSKRNCLRRGEGSGLSLAPYGVLFPEEPEQSHKRINKEALAECFDTKFITALCMSWTVWVLLSLCRYCSPFGASFVFRERFWKEIKDVRLLA